MSKLNRYEKILARVDKRRPIFVSELPNDKYIPQNSMVLSIKVLFPNGGTMKVDWSEKVADEMEARKILNENTRTNKTN